MSEGEQQTIHQVLQLLLTRILPCSLEERRQAWQQSDHALSPEEVFLLHTRSGL